MGIKSLLTMKTLSVLMLVTVLAACSSDEDKAGAGTGTGDGTGLGGSSYNSGDLAGSPFDPSQKGIGDRVFFEFNSDSITSEGQATLRRQAEWLNSHSGVNISVEGHCDERGTREFNLALGERRASAVKTYLGSLGVSTGRINTISYGKEHPEYVGSTEAAWSKNRRAVTVVN